MILINSENEYPRFIGDLQLEHPSWRPGDELPDGWKQVAEINKPKAESEKVVYEDFPKKVDGQFFQNWKIRKMTPEEIERKNAPETAKQKLLNLGLTEIEIEALTRGL